MKKDKVKELRLNEVENLCIRSDEADTDKMIVEGYPIVFDKEVFIDCGFGDGFFEKIDRHAFDNANMKDVCFKYNHNDDFFILARNRNGSLKLEIDDHGVFMHAELIDTTQNRDVYKMIQSGLLTEGSFAFTVADFDEDIIEDEIHRTIKQIGFLYDVAVCPNGAYGDLTEIYARSYNLLDNKNYKAKLENLKRCRLLKLRNKNKIKFMKGN